MSNLLSVGDLEEVLKGSNNSIFLSGNGFSINFDNVFKDIYADLFKAHKEVLHNTNYEVKAQNKLFKKKLNANYKNVLQYLRFINEEQLYKIFEDGIVFAETILNSKALYEELDDGGYLQHLTFKLSQWDILTQLCEVGKSKGFRYVNIEHWTILIFFYVSILRLKTENYNFPNDNTFIKVLEQGSRVKENVINHKEVLSYIIEGTMFNGFYNYYRMLFSVAVYADGKSKDITKLEGLHQINNTHLKGFLDKFNSLITLNFDCILEGISGRSVEHLHGKFVLDKKEYVYSQSHGYKHPENYVSFSDIMLGDYFLAKGHLPVISKLNMNQNPFNKKLDNPYDKLLKQVKSNNINTVMIFGMGIENDYHILRYLMLIMHEVTQQKPHIIYSYFTDQEKEQFREMFDRVMTFSKEVNKFSKDIKISFIRTQDVLEEYFYAINNEAKV